MSSLCGGKESWYIDCFYLLKYIVRGKSKRNTCPRCGHQPFKHGFFPNDDIYCTKCHLFEPDWDAFYRSIHELEKLNENI